MTRSGHTIGEYRVKNSVDPGISYAQKYLEFKACIAGGLDLEQWTENEYKKSLMADTIAFYLADNEIANNVEDAREKKAEQQRRRAKRR